MTMRLSLKQSGRMTEVVPVLAVRYHDLNSSGVRSGWCCLRNSERCWACLRHCFGHVRILIVSGLQRGSEGLMVALYVYIHMLVGGLEHGFYFSIDWEEYIIPTDDVIFFRGVGIPPTSIYILYMWFCHVLSPHLLQPLGYESQLIRLGCFGVGLRPGLNQVAIGFVAGRS